LKSRKIETKMSMIKKKDHQGHGVSETMEETKVVGAAGSGGVKNK
jgi:hypothetical protein